MRLIASCWLILVVIRAVYGVDLLMTPPVVNVFETQTFRATCLVTGEYQARYHSIHLIYHAANGKEIHVTNDETVSRALDQHRQLRYSIIKKTFGSGLNQRWEFTLTVVKATKVDAGRYQCLRIERSSRNTQYSTGFTTVFVNTVVPASPVAPQCALSPANPKPGHRTTFSCFSIGEAPKLSLSWKKGERKLESKTSNSTGKFNVVTFQRTLSAWDNNATFTCSATGLALGKETRTCSVVPFFIPTNVTVTSVQRVKTGEPAEFICLAVAVPTANKYIWIVNKGSRRDVIEQDRGRYVIEQGGALLRINSVSPTDNNSTVQCIARNDMNIEGASTGTLFTVPVTPSSRPGSGGIGNRHGNGDGNFVFFANGGGGLTPHPGLITPKNGRHDVGTNGYKGGRPNVPLLIGGTVGFVIFMTMIVFLLAVVMRSRTKRQKTINKADVHRRPISIISMESALDVEKADEALVKGSTLSRGHTLSRGNTLSRTPAPRKSVHTLPLTSSRKSTVNPDISRQQLADKLAATLRSKSYVSLLNTPLPMRPTDFHKSAEDCVSRVSTEDSAYDDLTCSMTSTVFTSRSNSNVGPRSCYGSVGSLPASVRYSRAKDQLEGIKSLDPDLHYAEIDWTGRKPPCGRILEGDEKTLYAQIRKK